jgi:hypothetical protein
MEKQAAAVNDGASNVVMGFKIFDFDFRCRGYQFPFGRNDQNVATCVSLPVAVHEGPVKMCESGFHFCQRAVDCLSYYSLDSTCRYAQVAASGIVITKDDKSVTNHLTLVRELSFDEFKDLCTGDITCWQDGNCHLTPYVKGRLHGTRTHWNEQGQVLSMHSYRDGLKHGECQEWYDNGQRSAIVPYRNGSIHGTVIRWHSNGQQSHQEPYVLGLRHGAHIWWCSKGQIGVVNVYKNGLFDRHSQRWNENGH